MPKPVLLLLAALSLAPTAQAFEFVDGTDGFTAFLDSVSADGAPGFAVMVSRGDEILVRTARGMADLESARAIDLSSRFYIASVAKTMTSAAVIMLRNDERLALSDRLNQYFPSAPDEVRLYHLLTHTSGIGDHLEHESLPNPVTNDWVVDFALKQPLLFEPGTDFAYSNTAYVLLAEVIRIASGMSYAEFLRTRIFEPLQMDDTVVFDHPQEIPERATGYITEDGRFTEADYEGMLTTGSGGIYSTVDDLMKWLAASTRSDLLSRRDWKLMQTPAVNLNGRSSWLAMGWSEETFGRRTPAYTGLEVAGSLGSFGGFQSTIAWFPELDLRFVLLCNSGEFPFNTLEVARHFVTPAE